jgi:hypothetical protein
MSRDKDLLGFDQNRDIGDDYTKYTDEPPDPFGQSWSRPTLYDLGFGDLFEGTTFQDDWAKYFDEYDPRREDLYRKHASTDISQLGESWGLKKQQLTGAWDLQQEQLGSAWDLRQKQLGETWQTQLGGIGKSFRLQTGGLGQQWQTSQAGMGAQARQGLTQAGQMEQQMAQRGRGLTFGGERERQSEKTVMENYARAFGGAKSAYEQAMAGATTGYRQGIDVGQERYGQAIESGGQAYEQAIAKGQLGYDQAIATGQLGYSHGVTDIGQGLESDVFSAQDAWAKQQRDWAFQLLSGDIYGGNT